MRKSLRLIALLLCLLLLPLSASALAWTWGNDETGFCAAIDDDANLLTAEGVTRVQEAMKPITENTNVGFYSYDGSSSRAVLSKAQAWGEQTFGKSASFTVFNIDMNTRRIGIYSSRDLYSVLTTGKANTITDNVYRYASRKDYDSCAEQVFIQMDQTIRGRKVAEPMKIASNAFLAVILAILVTYLLISVRMKKEQRVTLPEVVKAAGVGAATLVTGHVLTKVVHHESSSGGGGGGFGGGGGGGGGGSGGSHGF